MVDDDPDLAGAGGSAEEEGGGEKLTDDIQTFGEWRKKVLEEEQERENEKVKQMAKGEGVVSVC